VGGVATDAISARVKRLARPHSSGGTVIERSVILAEGDAAAIFSWISAHDGVADSTTAPVRSAGLHGSRETVRTSDAPARRFVLPAHAFD
jgi:hypothetical protein